MTAKDHYLTAIHTFWPTELGLKGPFERYQEPAGTNLWDGPWERSPWERTPVVGQHRAFYWRKVTLSSQEPHVPLLERVSEEKRASFNEGMENIKKKHGAKWTDWGKVLCPSPAEVMGDWKARCNRPKAEPEPALRHYCGGTMAPVGETDHHACLKCGFILSNEKLLNMSEADREKFAAPAEPEPVHLGWAMMEEGAEAPYYLTQGKRYPLITDGENAFTILCDDGTTTHCAWKVSSHLGYHNWIRIPHFSELKGILKEEPEQ